MKKDNVKTCPINNTFQIIGKKFAILILRNMILYNQTRFNQFLESVEGINSRTLSQRLRQLESTGIIKRKVIPETPIKIEYSLTEKGKQVKFILEQMGEFSTLHCSDAVFKDGKSRHFKEILPVIQGDTVGKN
ncbi:MAG: helix-turn-helix transcriptional regulator [Nitrosarchaeum sp.]|nr:helix-turn-helix transcriptional regulator [Nitrosarchaeum sp.]